MKIFRTEFFLAILLLCACASTKTSGTDENFLMSEVTLEDSTINQYLQSYDLNIRLINDIDTIKGKMRMITNYYKYYSLKKSFGDTDSITIINFGSYTSHAPSFMLITHKFKGKKEQLFFGRGQYDDELLSLNSFLSSFKGKLQENTKIIIIDLFLRCRRGQAKTPIYVS
jgi:hypothetical protein